MKPLIKILDVYEDNIYDRLFFPQKKGWLGGDAGCSIRLDKNKTLWLFGDTILGEYKNGRRNVLYPHINNSIAVTTAGHDEKLTTEFYWKEKNGVPVSFFTKAFKEKNIYFWPTNGLLIEKTLFIFCYVVKGNFDGNYLEFWETIDTELIIVKNPLDDPQGWVMDFIPLGLGNDKFGFHSALFYKKPDIHFIGYTTNQSYTKNAFLAIANSKMIIKNRSISSLKYYNMKTNKFDNQMNLIDNYNLFSPGNTESSLCYLKRKKIFMCTTYDPLSGELSIMTSKKIKGPWYGPQLVFKNPDHITMTYSFRIHPSLSLDENSIVMSFITSPDKDIRHDAVNQKYYRPRFLRMDIE